MFTQWTYPHHLFLIPHTKLISLCCCWFPEQADFPTLHPAWLPQPRPGHPSVDSPPPTWAWAPCAAAPDQDALTLLRYRRSRARGRGLLKCDTPGPLLPDSLPRPAELHGKREVIIMFNFCISHCASRTQVIFLFFKAHPLGSVSIENFFFF